MSTTGPENPEDPREPVDGADSPRSRGPRTPAAAARARAGATRAAARRERTMRWQTELRDEFATLSSDAEFDLSRRVRAVLTDVDTAVEQVDPIKEWNALAGWLRDRMAFELGQNHELVVTGMRALSVRSARRQGLGEAQIVDPPAPVTPTELSVSLERPPPVSDGSGLTTAMAVVLRGYLGFMMFFMITHAAGLSLPEIAGLVPAGLLAALALREELDRRRSTRQAVAGRVLGEYVGEFSLWVGKAGHDLLRRLETELRQGDEARLDQLERRERRLG